MKVTRIAGVTTLFKPITVAVTLESQEEVDAIRTASTNLSWSEIDAMHTSEDRSFWCAVLEAIGEEI